jgi:hypothetical protein
MAIEAEHYQKTRDALKKDPVILAMVAEIQRDMNYNSFMAMFTHNGTRRRTDEGDGPTFDFMGRALDEYKKRGGTIGSHIGGPAEAIIALMQEAEAQS